MNLLSITISNPENKTEYPFVSPLFQKGFKINFSPITIIVGENGIGKSTLLESIADKLEFPLTGGSANNREMYKDISFALNHYSDAYNTFSESINNKKYYQNTDNLELAKNMNCVWRIKSKKGAFIRSESFAMMINIPKFKHATNLSHGEGIVEVVKSIDNDGVYILDEPEAGLSPIKVIELMASIIDKTQTYHCQFILSTHSPILMLIPSAKLLYLDENSISKIDAEQTPHFKLTKQILNNSEEFLKRYFKSI